MLVTAGYWAYISNETQTLETVSVGNQNENTTSDEHLGDATLVSNNKIVDDKSNKNNENTDLQDKQETKETSASNKDDYFQESKL